MQCCVVIVVAVAVGNQSELGLILLCEIRNRNMIFPVRSRDSSELASTLNTVVCMLCFQNMLLNGSYLLSNIKEI